MPLTRLSFGTSDGSYLALPSLWGGEWPRCGQHRSEPASDTASRRQVLVTAPTVLLCLQKLPVTALCPLKPPLGTLVWALGRMGTQGQTLAAILLHLLTPMHAFQGISATAPLKFKGLDTSGCLSCLPPILMCHPLGHGHQPKWASTSKLGAGPRRELRSGTGSSKPSLQQASGLSPVGTRGHGAATPSPPLMAGRDASPRALQP